MNNSVFVYVTYIATTPEKLWEALTSGEFTRQYWFGRMLHTDWKEGSPVTFVNEKGEVTDIGQVMKCEPYTLLSYTMKCVQDHTDYEHDPLVTFELMPMDSTVKLLLKHEHLSSGAFQEESRGFTGVNNGWPAIMSNLKSLLETGRSLPAIYL